MKILTKIAYTAMASLAFSSCGDSANDSETSSSSSMSSSSTEQNEFVSSSSSVQRSSFCENSQSVEGEMPVMDCRVVSYKERAFEYISSIGFITNEDSLKLIFPYIFENKQTDCNHFFGIYFAASSLSLNYPILSQDMVLNYIRPGSASEGGWNCITLDDIFSNVMLVCDDTAEGDLKDRIDFNSYRIYEDPNWDCDKETEHGRGAFF
jgi:hypothetical protein